MPTEGSMRLTTSYINITRWQEIGGHLTIQPQMDIHFNFVTFSPFSGILLCKFNTATVFRCAVKVAEEDFNYRLPLCHFAQVWVMFCAEILNRVGATGCTGFYFAFLSYIGSSRGVWSNIIVLSPYFTPKRTFLLSLSSFCRHQTCLMQQDIAWGILRYHKLCHKDRLV
jgi:hypothetical protein